MLQLFLAFLILKHKLWLFFRSLYCAINSIFSNLEVFISVWSIGSKYLQLMNYNSSLNLSWISAKISFDWIPHSLIYYAKVSNILPFFDLLRNLMLPKSQYQAFQRNINPTCLIFNQKWTNQRFLPLLFKVSFFQHLFGNLKPSKQVIFLLVR